MMWIANSIPLRRRAFSESLDELESPIHFTLQGPVRPAQSSHAPSPPTPIDELPELVFNEESKPKKRERPPMRRRTVTSPPFMGSGLPEFLQAGHMTHKDFMPKVTKAHSDPFSSLVRRANTWLKDNPNLDLFSCETVTWSSAEGIPFFTDSTVINTASGGRKTHCTRGLRLWCLPKSAQTRSIDLSFKDYDVTSDNIVAALKHINDDLSNHLIQGRIIKVETNYKLEGSSADSTSWHESLNSSRKYVAFLRLFLSSKETQEENFEVVLRDFCPKFDSRSPHNNGWQRFEDLFPTVASWVHKYSGHFQLLNVQSINVQLTKDIKTDKVHNTSLWESPVFKLQGPGKRNDSLHILRVAYLRPTSLSQAGPPSRSRLTYKTFMPRGHDVINDLSDVNDKHYEELRSLVARVRQWLETSGATIQHIETIVVPYRQTTLTSDSASVDPELTFSSVVPFKNVPSPKVICLRLYVEEKRTRGRLDSQTQTSDCSSEEDIHL